jgi:tetratricopeptide (TPR) repeat protein
MRQAARVRRRQPARGLVHRDFKPDNLLVRRDGAVRVTDFGLARPTGAVERTPGSPSASPLEARLTESGVVVGTPAYMAPEQLAGQPVDARTDVFAFCLTFYEALFGERPAALAQTGARLRGVEGAPGWLRVALLRGLEPEPAHRWPSLAALAAELDRGASSRRPIAAWLLAGAALVGAAVWMQHDRHARAELCGGAETQLAGIWDAARRQAVERAFAATGKPNAADAARTVARELDERAGKWIAMNGEACRATRVRGVQSEELLGLRMSCLEQRRRELEALVGLFAGADGELVDRAAKAAAELPRIELCADARALSAPVKPPDPVARAAVDEQRALLARATALHRAGRFEPGLAAAQPIVDEARRLRYRPLEAEALLLVGQLRDARGDYPGAERALDEAELAAEAGRDDVTAARVATLLVGVVGLRQARHADADVRARRAEAAVERAGGGADLQGNLEDALGNLVAEEGHAAEAVAHHQRAVSLLEQAYGARAPRLAVALNNLAGDFSDVGRDAEALHPYERALAIREEALGAEHPDVGTALLNLAGVEASLGRGGASLEHFRRGCALVEHGLGASHPRLALCLNNWGTALLTMRRADEALPIITRALELREKLLGPAHPDVAMSLLERAEAQRMLHRLGEARASAERALAIEEKVQGLEHPDVANVLAALGRIALEGRNDAEAERRYRRALAIDERALGASSPRVERDLAGIGDLLLQRGDMAGARPLLERALRIREANPGEPATLADLRFAVARTLAPGESARALALAKDARAFWATQPPGPQLRDLDAWLQKRN